MIKQNIRAKLINDINNKPEKGIGAYYQSLAKKYKISKHTVLYYALRRGKNKAASVATSKITRVPIKTINVTNGAEVIIGDMVIKVPGNSITINGNELRW